MEREHSRIEVALQRVGGPNLLNDARMESEWYVALFFPWDGNAIEPIDRLRARTAFLLDRLERAVGFDV